MVNSEIIQPDQFFKMLLNITSKRNEFNHAKLSSLYVELLLIKWLYDSLSLEEDRAAKMSCLKSAYLLAEPLVNSFLKQIDTVLLRQGINNISFNKFMKQIETHLKFDLEKLHSYYTTVTFRNKLIAHNDHVRQEAKQWSKEGEFYYLPHAYDLDSGDIESISALRKSYLEKFDSEELKNEINFRQMLEFLFYNYPSFEVLEGSIKYSISPERREIDNLSEKIGVKSKPIDSVIISVSDLMKELVNVSLSLCS